MHSPDSQADLNPGSEIARLLARARASLQSSGSDGSLTLTALNAIDSAALTMDYGEVKKTIQKYIQEAEKTQFTLRELLAQLQQSEAIWERRERYEQPWWERTRAALELSFHESPSIGFAEWLKTFADAFLAWELELCTRIANEPLPFLPDHAGAPTLLQQGMEALRKENTLWEKHHPSCPATHSRALRAIKRTKEHTANVASIRQMLEFLSMAITMEHLGTILDSTSSAQLGILMGRIYLYTVTDRDAALKSFSSAKELAPTDSRPLAALGDYYRADKAEAQALQFYRQANERTPEQPAGFVGLGLLSEMNERWTDAAEWYDRALKVVAGEKHPDVALTKMLAPVSGNLYLQIARMLEKQDPERALQALKYAVEIGVKGEGQYPERVAYELEGQIQQARNMPREAAEAFLQAGRRYVWRNESPPAIKLLEAAVEQLKHAKVLEPNQVATYWYLADSYRMASYVPGTSGTSRDWLKRSLRAWSRGAAHQLPTSGDSWAYSVRALVNQKCADDDPTGRIPLLWQAIVFLDRGILLNANDTHRWTYLGRYYHALGLEANGELAARKAMELDTSNVNAIDELAGVLADMGKFDEALTLLEQRLKDEPENTWAISVKAYCLLHRDAPGDALDLINSIIPKEGPSLWNFDFRGLCYRILDDLPKALEDYQRIRKMYKESGSKEPSERNLAGTAAFQSGEFNEAAELLEPLRSDFVIGAEVHRTMGLVGLAQAQRTLAAGQVERAQEQFSSAKATFINGIQSAKNVRELDSLDYDFRELPVRFSANADTAQLERTLAEIIAARDKRRAELDLSPRTAEQELKEVARESEAARAKWRAAMAQNPRPTEQELQVQGLGAQVKWSWIAAQAGLARLETDAKEYRSAGDRYLALMRDAARFPEARLGLEKVADTLVEQAQELAKGSQDADAAAWYGLALNFEQVLAREDKAIAARQALGDILVKGQQPHAALEHFTALLALDAVKADPVRGAVLETRASYAALRGGDTVAARARLFRAVQLFRESDKSAHPGAAIGSVSRTLLTDPQGFWELDDTWKTFEDDPGTPADLKLEVAEARAELFKFLKELYKPAPGDKATERLPVVTPIVVELGTALVPQDTGPEWSLFKTHIPAMRERIKSGMGVRVPGVRVRQNELDLAPTGYMIQLDEVPIVVGTALLDSRYSPTDRASLVQAGIPEADLEESPDPVTGAPGCWVSQDAWQLAESKGIPLWSDAWEYIVNHLASLLSLNLTDFFGVQEVEILLDEWSEQEEGRTLVEAALPSPRARLGLTALLSALVAERVPITRWQKILQATRAHDLEHDETDRVVRTVRLAIKDQLQEIAARGTQIAMPAELEDKIASNVQRVDNKTFLALSPDDTQEILAGLRPLFSPNGVLTVLVTKSSQVRPFVRRLAQIEFPRLYVMSQDELAASKAELDQTAVEHSAESTAVGASTDE